jgi:hypothetical protein
MKMLGVRALVAHALVLIAALVGVGPAQADGCSGSGQTVGDFVAVALECSSQPELETVQQDGEPASATPTFIEYKWVSACTSPDAAGEPSTVLDCAPARSCPDPVERLWRLWGRTPPPTRWALLGTQCFGRPPTVADTPRPQVTPGMVLNALRRIGLPELTARTQPADKTLVNFATIFYAEPEPFARSIRLLGQRVDVEATPSQFTWHYGDGTSESTTTPGAPYPSKEITYSYTDAHTTVSTSVDVTYAARFRVNGGGWQDIAETVTITGPPTDLRISEATAVLSGNYE